ncbi:MAG: hypothetical protein HYZ81_06905 [Nitrospinae bacterium]|nr:hypothetical protein [Nitrospinota bacterium]
MTYKEFATASATAQVTYHHNYVTCLLAQRRREDGTTERMVIACPACQSTAVTRLNFSAAMLRGEPLQDQCDRCRHRFREDDGLVLPPGE